MRKRFEKIGEAAARGASNTELSYSFLDHSFGYLAPVLYYRLRSVDHDGSFQSDQDCFHSSRRS